jgi:hypothetical protein
MGVTILSACFSASGLTVTLLADKMVGPIVLEARVIALSLWDRLSEQKSSSRKGSMPLRDDCHGAARMRSVSHFLQL